MTSVNATTINQAASPSGVVKKVQPSTDAANPNLVSGASRVLGETIAGVGGKALEMGKDVAQKGATVLADVATHHAEEKARHALRFMILNRMRDLGSAFAMLPGGEILLGGIISNFFFPYYKQVNPESTLTADHLTKSLIHGHLDSLENEVFETLDKFIKSNLKEEERVKYESGDKMVVLKAFKNLTMSQINTAREPGGIAKICGGIANFIPLVNKLPAAVKPWVGGAVGVVVAYKLAKLALYMVKKALWLVGGILGIKFLVNKFGGGAGIPAGLAPMPVMHGEESAAEGGGMMSKIMSGVNKAAQMAAQAQGGGGHGAPGGGFGQALAALAGGAGGGH